MNQRYDRGREAFGEAEINWAKDQIVAYLVSNAYVPKVGKHRTVSDLSDIVAGPVALEGKTIKDGYAAAGQVVFEAVKAEAMIRAMVIAKKNAALIAYMDEVTGFPMRSNGGDVVIATPKDKPWFFRL